MKLKNMHVLTTKFVFELITSAEILNCLFCNKSIYIPLHPLPTGNMHSKYDY